MACVTAGPMGPPRPPAAVPLRPVVRPATEPAGASAARLRRLAESVAARLPWMTRDFIYDRPPELGPDAAEMAAL